jgi:hypothetical protein
MKPDLHRRAVFLSASFPTGPRGEAFPSSDPAAVADAVTAIVRTIFAVNGRLVFGGHPTITPLVLHVAGDRGYRERVDVYQSQWFSSEVPQETLRLEELGFGRIYWTPAATTLAESLHAMRIKMLRDSDPVGAIFIGGMEGIHDEWELFGELAPGHQRIALVAPGGASAELVEENELPEVLRREIGSPHYPALARRIIEHFAASEEPPTPVRRSPPDNAGSYRSARDSVVGASREYSTRRYLKISRLMTLERILISTSRTMSRLMNALLRR